MARLSIPRTCRQCGKEFFREGWRIREGNGHKGLFCSRACSNAHHRFTRARREVKPLAERFWERISKGEGCWLWTGHRDVYGYGSLGERRHKAHRVSWQLHFGPIPEGMQVCHSCDVPACVNPAHLFLGTIADNMADKMAKGRQPKGEQRPDAKLTDESVRAIRAACAAGEKQEQVAERHGVSRTTVSLVVSRKRWGHVD